MDLDNIQRKYGLPAPLPVVQNGKFAPRFPLNLEHRGDDVFQFGGKYIGEIENIYDLLYKILTNQEIDASLALPYAIKITEDKLYIRDKTNSEWILIFDITKPNFPKEIELYELIYKAITHQVIGEDTSYPGQFKIEENILYVRDKDNLTWTQIGDVTKEFLGATEATQAILEQINEILIEVQELKTELNRQIATTNETLTTALKAANEAMTSAQSINIRTFNSVEEMKASNTLKAGALAKTLGFYTAGDGGGADYLITDNIGEDEVDEASVITLQKGLYAKLLVQDYINVKQMGAKGDGETDNTELIQNILNKFNKIYFPSGSYLITKTLKVKEGTQILGTRKSFIPNASYVNAQPRGISSESQFICAITDIENSSIFNCDKLVTIKGLDIYYPNQNYSPTALEDIVAYKPTILLNSYGCNVENIYVCGANSFLYASNATQTIVKNIFGFAFSKAFTFINGRDTVYFSNIQFNITANVMSVDVVNRLIFNNTFLEMIDCDGIITNNIGCILFNNVFVFTYNKHTTRANTLLINNVFIDTSGNIFTVTTGVASPNLIKANNIVAVGGYAEDGGCFLRFNVTEPSSLYRIAQFNNVGYSVGSTITTLKVPTYYIKILNSSDTPNTKYHNLYLMFNNCSFEPTAEMTNQGEKIPFIYNQATNDFIKLTGTIFKDGEIIDTQTLQINAEQATITQEETIDTQEGE